MWGYHHLFMLLNEHADTRAHTHTNMWFDCPFESARETWEDFVNRSCAPRQNASWCEREASLNVSAVGLGALLASFI